MIVLAIDPGIEKVGYSIFEKKVANNYSFIASGLIKTDKKLKHEQRLKLIYDRLEKLAHEHDVTQVVMEQLFFFKNQKTVISVAQAQGVMQLLTAQKNIPIWYLTPLEIKQIITGYGSSDKQAVHKMLQLLLKHELKVADDDESDAIACGLAFCCINENLI